MSKLSSELRLTVSCHMWSVTCVVNSEFAVARGDMYLNVLLLSLLSPRDTFFRDRSEPEGRRYRTLKRGKKEKETRQKRP